MKMWSKVMTCVVVACTLPARAETQLDAVRTMEDAIASVRQAAPGSEVQRVEQQCDGPQACGFVIEVTDAQGRRQVFRVARAGPTGVAAVATASTATQTRSAVSADADAVQLRLSGSLTLGAGQMAGMGNVILDPTMQAGVAARLNLRDHPDWDVDARVGLIAGRTETTDPATQSRVVSKMALQEVRGQAHAIYNFHRDGDVAKAGVGLYVDFARGLNTYPRYTPSTVDDIYAAEEGEITRSMVDTGVDLRFQVNEQRLSSELHNVLFLSGNRIAPNLLTYKPMLGFMWSNAFMLSGTRDEPGWRLLTNVDFYFARKAGVRYFNSHDGLGGTKREIDLSYGLGYDFTRDTNLTVMSYGYNNLNRGNSSAVPVGFKDGLSVTLSHNFQ